MIKKNCLFCKKEFKSKPSVKSKYCSRECFYAKDRENIICPICNKSFIRRKSKKQIFCSHKCSNKTSRKHYFQKGHISYWKGKKFSKEYRRKLSEAHRKIMHWNQKEKTKKICLQCGIEFYVNPCYKYRKYCSQKCYGVNSRSISYGTYPPEWTKELRESIRKRDHYECKLCFIPQLENIRKLSIHHIDYNKSNCNPDNLISLCVDCHSKVNYRRNNWKDFLSIVATLNLRKTDCIEV